MAVGVLDPARGAGLRELEDSWLLAPRDSWRLLGSRDAGEPLPRESGSGFWLGAGQGTLFSVPGLEQVLVAGGLGFKFLGRKTEVGANYQQMGREYFRETRAELDLLVGGSRGLGVSVARFAVGMAGQRVDARWEARATARRALVLGPDRSVRLTVRLALELAGTGNRATPRRDFLLLTFEHGRSVLAFQLDRQSDGTPVLGGEVFQALQPGIGLALRVDPVTASLGPGLSLRRGSLLLRTSHLAHPVLGQTHRFHLAYIQAHD
jgi:hypothetical protein